MRYKFSYDIILQNIHQINPENIQKKYAYLFNSFDSSENNLKVNYLGDWFEQYIKIIKGFDSLEDLQNHNITHKNNDFANLISIYSKYYDKYNELLEESFELNVDLIILNKKINKLNHLLLKMYI